MGFKIPDQSINLVIRDVSEENETIENMEMMKMNLRIEYMDIVNICLTYINFKDLMNPNRRHQ